MISTEMRIIDILEQYPQTLSVFASVGFSAGTKEALIDELGEFAMLKTALKVKGINAELFIRMMEEKISENSEMLKTQDVSGTERLNFLGYTHCPLKQTFKDCFEDILRDYIANTGDSSFKYFVPSGCGGNDPFENIWQARSIDELPEIIASVGFGDFFRKEFVDRFVSKGYFESVKYDKLSDVFASAGFEDPDGWYTIYAVSPLVMLIDRKKLGDLPMPRQWGDLLDPIYKDNIIIGAGHGKMFDDLLMNIYKEYGEEGLAKLAANVKDGWHPSQMAKTAGTVNSEGAAIYTISWLFAESCPRTDTTEIIWPSDGAITDPLYMLVKKQAKKDYKTFTDLITGHVYGQKIANNYYAVLNPDTDNKFPPKASLKWLGWDYIRSHDMGQLKEDVLNIFGKYWTKELKTEGIAI